MIYPHLLIKSLTVNSSACVCFIISCLIQHLPQNCPYFSNNILFLEITKSLEKYRNELISWGEHEKENWCL